MDQGRVVKFRHKNVQYHTGRALYHAGRQRYHEIFSKYRAGRAKYRSRRPKYRVLCPPGAVPAVSGVVLSVRGAVLWVSEAVLHVAGMVQLAPGVVPQARDVVQQPPGVVQRVSGAVDGVPPPVEQAAPVNDPPPEAGEPAAGVDFLSPARKNFWTARINRGAFLQFITKSSASRADSVSRPPGVGSLQKTTSEAGGSLFIIMLVTFDFEYDRTGAILAAMILIPTFHPDAKTTADVIAMQTPAQAARDAYIDKEQSLSLLLGAVDVAWKNVHDASVAVHGAMRSLYRRDPASLRALESIPVQDQSRREIELRARALMNLWPKLPLPPGYPVPPGPGPHYVEPYAGMTLLVYTGLYASAVSTENQVDGVRAEFEKAEGVVHDEEAILRDFNVNAREQGLLQFTSGWQREVIEAIPTEPPSLPPAKGEIQDVEAPGGTNILVKATAAHASMFTLKGKGPGMAAFVDLVVDWPLVRIPCTLPSTGAWILSVQGKNAKGEGEWSDDYEVTVPA